MDNGSQYWPLANTNVPGGPCFHNQLETRMKIIFHIHTWDKMYGYLLMNTDVFLQMLCVPLKIVWAIVLTNWYILLIIQYFCSK